MFQLQFFLLHCDEWDRVVALPRHKFFHRCYIIAARCPLYLIIDSVVLNFIFIGHFYFGGKILLSIVFNFV
jgi:hypothetical protein